MATTEHTINDGLADVLRSTRRVWRPAGVVRSENTGMLKGSAGRPDVLVLEPNVSPVVIETEVLPAATVESEATSRLGKQISTNGRTILSAIAVRLPRRLREKDGDALKGELNTLRDLDFALYTGSSATAASRWPRSGWINGGIAELSTHVQSASLPPDIIEAAVDQLVSSVSEAAGMIGDMAATHPNAIKEIGAELRQEDGDQTRRMAATILANAFVFQETLSGGPGKLAEVHTLDQLRGTGLTKTAVLAEWRKILKVNYWPIFDIARRILELIPTADSRNLMECMAVAASRLLENRLMSSHDLTGAVFQRLIADRKFLAAYYTTPASAALLIGLVLTAKKLPTGGSWAATGDVVGLRIADFACGTGTLLSTAYQRVGQLHELAGGDAEAIHPQMMAKALVGCDVLPAAAHLTASMLSGAHPSVKYKQSSILTVAYGKQPDGAIALGSLDLLDAQRKLEITDITAKSIGGTGQAEKETWSELPHASFDLVIMNPPFTRATGQEGAKVGVPNPMFAAFGSSEKDQRLMAAAASRLTKGTSARGNAGEASIFLVLADRKLKEDGALALVMPLSLMSGETWEESRILLKNHYQDLLLLSISGADGTDLSFSADTAMGECLIVGRKARTGSKRAVFVILRERPAFPMLGSSAAAQILQLIAGKNLRRIEDGPVGGTPLFFGDEEIGQALGAPLPTSGGWNLSRIADLALAQTAYQLIEKSRLWLPGMRKEDTVDIPMTTVGAIGEIGPYHMDVSGTTADGDVRGPFRIAPMKAGTTPTYPVLWSHSAAREKAMEFTGDSEAQPLVGKNRTKQDLIDKRVESVWATASHCHFNRDFRFNSQATGMQFTPRRTIGGRAWLSIQLSCVEEEKALVAWANTSLGLLLHWWHSNKQQSGRGSVGKSTLDTLPVLDVTALQPARLKKAVAVYDAMKNKEFSPVHQMGKDAVRKELDEMFVKEVLDLQPRIYAADGPLEVLRMKLAQEPSILGAKSL